MRRRSVECSQGRERLLRKTNKEERDGGEKRKERRKYRKKRLLY